MFARSCRLLAAFALAAFVAACSSPEEPSPVLVNENFNGTLAVGGTGTHNFTVTTAQGSSDGAVRVVSLTSAAGTAVSTTIGVGFGSIEADGSCRRSTVLVTTTATIGVRLVAPAAFLNSEYCVQIFDAGTLTEPVNYSLNVEHY